MRTQNGTLHICNGSFYDKKNFPKKLAPLAARAIFECALLLHFAPNKLF
jgi:hypothetical protein